MPLTAGPGQPARGCRAQTQTPRMLTMQLGLGLGLGRGEDEGDLVADWLVPGDGRAVGVGFAE
jgi:hypothetical protein